MIRIRFAAALGLALALAPGAGAQQPEASEPAPEDLGELLRGAQELLGTGEAAAPLDREEASRVFDAFLTFVVKRAAREAVDLGLRADLLAALLDGRHDAVSLVSGELGLDEAALRDLLGVTWPRLQPLLAQLVQELGS